MKLITKQQQQQQQQSSYLCDRHVAADDGQ